MGHVWELEGNDPPWETLLPVLQSKPFPLSSPAQHGFPITGEMGFAWGPSEQWTSWGAEGSPWVLPLLHTQGTLSELPTCSSRLLFLR